MKQFLCWKRNQQETEKSAGHGPYHILLAKESLGQLVRSLLVLHMNRLPLCAVFSGVDLGKNVISGV